MAKKLISILLIIIMIPSIAGCAKAPEPADFADKIYIYKGKGAGGQFAVTLYGDGTFWYYEGLESSYIGNGKWSVENDLICLTDDTDDGSQIINYFRFEDGELVYSKKTSTGFTYVELADGATFSFSSSVASATEEIG